MPPPAPRVLHALWLPDTSQPALFIWAESAQPRQRRPAPPAHPFAAPAEELRGLPGLGAAKRKALTLALPSAGHAPLPSHPILGEAAPDGKPAFAAWRVEGLTLEPHAVLPWLLRLPGDEALRSEGVLGSDSLRFWLSAGRLAWELLAGEHFLPDVEQSGAAASSLWRPILDAPAVAEKVRLLEDALPPACLSFALSAKTAVAATDAPSVLRDFFLRVVDAELRRAAETAALRSSRTPQDAWLSSLASRRADFPGTQVEEVADALASWKRRLEPACGAGLRACLHLAEPTENGGEWRLEYLLQATADRSLLVDAKEVWRGGAAARKLSTLSGVDPEERLLAALALAGRVFSPIERSLKSAQPAHAALDAGEAHRFLKEAAPVLADSGFGVFLPPWWKAPDAPRLSVQLRVRPAGEGRGTDSWLEFDWRAAMGGQVLSEAELEELARMKVPLAQVRGQWVEVDRAAIRDAIAYWDRRKKGGLTLGEALARMRQSGEKGGLPVSELEASGWLKDFLDGTSEESSFTILSAPSGLRGTLRPYQERGFSWLAFLRTHGFGACLADDMGLGKTIQSLALVLREKEAGRLKAPALLVCPTSVAGNWTKEAARFAPGLKVLLHHGTGRRKSPAAFRRQVRSHDLVVSTYGLARRDEKLLRAQPWSGVLLDEAQNIKNPEAKQSRALRGLKAGFRVALTGTPVENRLSELWSIMEFLNPGYLGGGADFHSRFAAPIERFSDPRATALLKRLAQPFVLRRLKTDSRIVPDLPEKMEMKVFCTLTREQATLYRAVVKDMLEQISAAQGIARRGLILAALTKLKQVTNHPVHFLKDDGALPGRSGKLDRLSEMLEEALSAGDSALVFTQFTEMGELLKRHLQATLLEEVLFFHGGLLKGARDRMVERFQAGEARILVLSLKAGGTGLNLTRASHVFHYDRWWNPAVENQATDRAFRIGQTKRVQAHKFLCAGTVEEKIDAMIESKKALAANVLGAGEAWLTELSNAELRGLFELREDALEAAS